MDGNFWHYAESQKGNGEDADRKAKLEPCRQKLE